MTKDEMIHWFKSAPKGSRHQRMLWAARKIARLTGVTEGGAYQMLLMPDCGFGRCDGHHEMIDFPSDRATTAIFSPRRRSRISL
jgi:hypothetical protein